MWPEYHKEKKKKVLLEDLSLDELFDYFEPEDYEKTVKCIHSVRYKDSYLIEVHYLEVTNEGIVETVEHHYGKTEV